MSTKGTVVLAGGIGGHELWLGEPTYRSPRLVWLSYSRMILMWRALGVPEPLGPILPGGPLPMVYDLLIANLEHLGWTVRRAHLDWRDTLLHDAGRLVDAIRTARSRADGPVHLIGHSRGGLVMRRALGLLRDAGQRSMVGKMVGLGVPHRGSWSMALLLGGDQQTGELLYNLLGRVGVRKQDLLAMVDGWPSAYELLPEPGSAWVSHAEADRAFAAASYGAAPFVQSLADAAREAIPAVPELREGDEWLDVVGVGSPTPSGPAATGTFDDPATVLLKDDGDSVISRRSYEDWLGASTFEVRLTHDRLVQDGPVIKEVDKFLLS